MHESDRLQRGLPGLRILASATVGVSPQTPGLGTVSYTHLTLPTN